MKSALQCRSRHEKLNFSSPATLKCRYRDAGISKQPPVGMCIELFVWQFPKAWNFNGQSLTRQRPADLSDGDRAGKMSINAKLGANHLKTKNN